MQDRDFLSYSNPKLSASLRGADACIWTLGITPSQVPDEQGFQRVTVEYTAQAARAFNDAFTSSNNAEQGKKFRFACFSSGVAERDQPKPLWFNAGYRRGQAEHVLLEHAASHLSTFDSYIMRPGIVLSRQGTFIDRLRGLAPSVRVDVLAHAAVDIAIQGQSEKIWENGSIAGWGNTGGRDTSG